MSKSSGMADKDLKDQGNKLFALRKYDDAINCYTKAIGKNPSQPCYFTNRALCHLKLKRWEAACQDSRRALDLDSNNVKGHFFLGSGLLELKYYDECIKHLQRAYDLAKELKQNYGDDITCQIRTARKMRWNILEEKRIAEEEQLLPYLNKLIFDDCHRQIDELKKQSGVNPGTEDDQNTIVELETKCDSYIERLNTIFLEADDKRRKRDVPDYLCGKISFELLRDPVITPSGMTYERKDIIEHLQKVGHFDPITREKLTSELLIPNYAMKEVVEAFVQENEWALNY